jgi:hypothetical protein
MNSYCNEYTFHFSLNNDVVVISVHYGYSIFVYVHKFIACITFHKRNGLFFVRYAACNWECGEHACQVRN